MTLSNEVMAKRYANEETMGHSRNMYIDDDDLYSYETVIARRLSYNTYVVSRYYYSSSTQRHVSEIIRALRRVDADIVEITVADINDIQGQTERNNAEISLWERKAARARKEHTYDSYMRRIEFLREQNELINIFFGR